MDVVKLNIQKLSGKEFEICALLSGTILQLKTSVAAMDNSTDISTAHIVCKGRILENHETVLSTEVHTSKCTIYLPSVSLRWKSPCSNPAQTLCKARGPSSSGNRPGLSGKWSALTESLPTFSGCCGFNGSNENTSGSRFPEFTLEAVALLSNSSPLMRQMLQFAHSNPTNVHLRSRLEQIGSAVCLSYNDIMKLFFIFHCQFQRTQEDPQTFGNKHDVVSEILEYVAQSVSLSVNNVLYILNAICVQFYEKQIL